MDLGFRVYGFKKVGWIHTSWMTLNTLNFGNCMVPYWIYEHFGIRYDL